MNQTVAVGAFCASLLLPALSWSAYGMPADSIRADVGPRAPLWMQAVEIFETNKDLVPGKAIQKIQEIDDHGRVKSEQTIESSFSLDEAGKIRSNIIRALEDGKDITAEQRKKVVEAEKKDAKRKSDKRSHSLSLGNSPFSAERQGDVRVTETTTREMVDGAMCIRFEYSYPEKSEDRSKGKPATVTGSAWIEEKTGRPRKLEFTTDPLPKHAKSMSTTVHYGADENGAWVAKRMLFEASGAFLFLDKRIRGDFLFSNYWKYEERQNERQ